jgi:hypothetical protein
MVCRPSGRRGDLVDAGQPRGLADLLVGGAGAAQADVVLDRAFEQVDVLEDQGELGHQLLGGEVADVLPADADRAGVHVPEPGDQPREGGLARPGGAHQRGHGAWRHPEADAVEHGRLVPLGRAVAVTLKVAGGGVGEPDGVELDRGRWVAGPPGGAVASGGHLPGAVRGGGLGQGLLGQQGV